MTQHSEQPTASAPEPLSPPAEGELTDEQLAQVTGGVGTYSKTLTFTLSTTTP
jgi:bacteriocin-like protein